MRLKREKFKKLMSCALAMFFMVAACVGLGSCTMFPNEYIMEVNTAIIEKDMQTLQELLEEGGDLNQREFALSHEFGEGPLVYNRVPLCLAAARNDLAVAKLLVAYGADVNYTCLNGNDKLAPLHHAAGRGNLEMINFLLDNGADVNIQVSYYGTPISYCLATSGMVVVDKNGDEDRITVEEMEERRFQAFCLLLERGAELENACVYGHLMFLIIARGKTAIFEYVVENYAIDYNMRMKLRDRYFTDDMDYTLLMMAAEAGNLAFCQRLLEKGADKNLKNIYNQTAYDIAVEFGHEEVANLLK